MENTSNANVYVLRFDDTYDFEIFGSITEVVNCLICYKTHELTKNQIRKIVVQSLENSTSFSLGHKEFFVKQKKMKVEYRLHS